MINPSNITNYNLDENEIEITLLFWLLVSGKTAKTTAKCLDSLIEIMNNWHNQIYGEKKFSPFEMIKNMDTFYKEVSSDWLAILMKKVGIGCYGFKSRGCIELSNGNLDLRSCSPEDLEKITGIGPKTSRAFIIHSRPNQKYACLDTHVLHFMRDKGYDVPHSTPTGKKYKQIEQIWLKLANESGMSLTDYDLKIWKEYSGN
jgi:thermostable 8-oxoguanine DNA glycosylase